VRLHRPRRRPGHGGRRRRAPRAPRVRRRHPGARPRRRRPEPPLPTPCPARPAPTRAPRTRGRVPCGRRVPRSREPQRPRGSDRGRPTGGLGGCRASLEVRTLRASAAPSGRPAYTALIPGASRRLSVAHSRGGRARLSPKGTPRRRAHAPHVPHRAVRQTLDPLPSPPPRR
jgi:hypothetical protein